MTALDRLLRTMRTLRDPEAGCPWDREQTFSSLARYTIEEAYEVVEAIEDGNLDRLRGELGDLLLQVVFHARMAEEIGAFTFEDVAEAIAAKLIRRHPHVFDRDGEPVAPEQRVADVSAVNAIWAAAKSQERKDQQSPIGIKGISDGLGGVARGTPALLRADMISSRAAAHGFDWATARDIVAKIREEVDEVEAALSGEREDEIADEIGDLLLATANLSRFLGLDSERVLHASIGKFERRFRAMAERLADEGKSLDASDIAEMERAWQAIKAADGTG